MFLGGSRGAARLMRSRPARRRHACIGRASSLHLASSPRNPRARTARQVKSYLAGNPPIKIKLNDDLLIAKRDNPYGGGGGFGGGRPRESMARRAGAKAGGCSPAAPRRAVRMPGWHVACLEPATPLALPLARGHRFVCGPSHPRALISTCPRRT